MIRQLTGECLCGQVRFIASGELKRVSACYCGQCRRQNGGGPFYGVELQGELQIENEKPLQWYASSRKARRGFCGHCGSSLFWQANHNPSHFDVSIGALNDVDDLVLDAHIFVEHCPSYMTVDNSAPHLTEADVLAHPLKDSEETGHEPP